MKRLQSEVIEMPIFLFTRKKSKLIGYTEIVKGAFKDSVVPFWRKLKENDQLDCLMSASMITPTLFGCGSFDEECETYPSGSYRYTACIEESDYIDVTQLTENATFSLAVPESEWISFELSQENLLDCWDDDLPYSWIEALGYSFNHEVGFHYDVFPVVKGEEYYPTNSMYNEEIVQIWMPVIKNG